MDKATALDKIKKCLNLAKSANEHEAAAALRQAQKLMAEHGVDADDLEMLEVSQQGVKASSSRVINWEATLAQKVADAFACHLMALHVSFREMQYMFIGCGSAPEVAQYAFRVLQRQCKAARAAHIKRQPKSCKASTKTARGDMFASAWVYAVGGLIERFSGNPANARAIDIYMDRNFPDRRSVRPEDRAEGRNTRDDDVAAGLHAGKSAQLNHGVSGAAARALIGQ